MTRNVQDIKNSMLKNQDDQFFEIIFERSDEGLEESLKFQNPFIYAGSKFRISSYVVNENNLTLRVVAISENGLHDAFTQWSTLQDDYYDYVYAKLTSSSGEQFYCYCHSVESISNGSFEVIFMISV